MTFEKSSYIGYKIINYYKIFFDVYTELKKDFGEIFIIELLSWRLHKDVLNFEDEASLNFFNINNLIQKERVLINDYIDEDGKVNRLDNQTSIMLISANP
jgi:hypothetical protein